MLEPKTTEFARFLCDTHPRWKHRIGPDDLSPASMSVTHSMSLLRLIENELQEETGARLRQRDWWEMCEPLAYGIHTC